MFKLLVVTMLVAILIALGSALFTMLNHRGDPERMVRALTTRVALSVTLFALLLVGMATGFITPHGIE